ncbi:hypothetical protein A3F00_00285 [Candidatus Daviesbacteria bacterium RIFCSPHIGHO2_12_FULL_37_11]|uniref:PIN domain-containing protein n=1 Tax=Candidatus Daviesbacteria bacterium RIFCSPHIGHO2_12_FULL_37_11 TaxID=1797777 RepID=A0A1F5KBD5_9BACT|nr:MAG: hypothetical protein A2111_01380 [Candidatus Daviesbacteria bacterium GWA1_38_6]OGE16278.1 MAG: hypothetical protein A2769_03320 [Candidatus Daviesbacteria bacterium RIFCSPHIGHO2_01_FULL_37_27]OGE37931.1 MAG: hypothetical protein A3F00_00285 [Candidatus Daviesbacteria bacterium RIFCSPHIGHO2_12_FULL_37_11]OGE45275.1 MAG: hypothetical protein A3B39_04080 [Candidatus Daviesbacteria bacterium RIFCSPLOWO2_01_FULL_37_10]
MAKVLLDANYFIGLANRSPEVDTKILDKHQGFIATLSCHILFYINKIDVPDSKMNSFIADFNLIGLDQDILSKALNGPTSDLEDNIQLHSGAEADCDIFLTKDKQLLNMKFFGKLQILSTLNK